MYLSDHFNLLEASKSQIAIRHGIDNVPPAMLMGNLELMAQNILEAVRDEYGEPFSPQSWYRSDALNRLVSGATHSFHCKGLAVDVELLGWDNEDFAHWCAEHLSFDKVILEYYQPGQPKSGWVHIQIMPNSADNREEFLTFDGKSFTRI